MAMIRKFIITTVFLLLALAVSAQKSDDISVSYNKLATQCERVVELNNKRIAKADSIRMFKGKIDSLKNAWRTTCVEVLKNPGNRTSEVIDTLIAHSDCQVEAGLIKWLEAVKNNPAAYDSMPGEIQDRRQIVPEHKPEPATTPAPDPVRATPQPTIATSTTIPEPEKEGSEEEVIEEEEVEETEDERNKKATEDVFKESTKTDKSHNS